MNSKSPPIERKIPICGPRVCIITLPCAPESGQTPPVLTLALALLGNKRTNHIGIGELVYGGECCAAAKDAPDLQ